MTRVAMRKRQNADKLYLIVGTSLAAQMDHNFCVSEIWIFQIIYNLDKVTLSYMIGW